MEYKAAYWLSFFINDKALNSKIKTNVITFVDTWFL